jgi:O-antigen ligase
LRIEDCALQITDRQRANSEEQRSEQSTIRNPQSAIRNVIAGGLMLAVVFTTLALGTVEAWSVAIFELVVVILLLLWSAKAIVDKHIDIKFQAAALPLGAFVLLGLIQSVAITGSESRTSSLSMDVEATRGAALVISFLFACFVIASNFFDTPERLRGLARFLIVFGLALAVFALIQHFTWEGKLFWARPTTAAGAGTGGPFVNRNHFAGYMEMLIPIPVALALSRRTRFEARLFYGFAATIMGIAEAASLSRGGIISLFAGLVFFGAISARNKDRSRLPGHSSFTLRPAHLVALVLIAILVGVVWVGADFDILKRIADDTLSGNSPMGREGIWGDAWAMFRAHPIFGVGLGAFETVYPIYARGNGSLAIQFAHNDYLQILSDGGIIGGALALWFLAMLARTVVKTVGSEDSMSRSIRLGSAAGLFALLVHSLFDFNLQIPSNALLFLILSAIVSNEMVTVNSQTEPRSRTRIGERELAALARG